MTGSRRTAIAGALLLIPLLAAACGAATTPGPSPIEAATQAHATDPPAASTPSVAQSTPSTAGPTPGGGDVTGIDACTLITQAEAEAALGTTTRPPFGGGTPDVNIRSCLFASKDGNGPQVGVAVSGAPDPFRPDLAVVPVRAPYSSAPTAVAGLGDEAWWWLEVRGLRLEARHGDRYVAFEYNDLGAPEDPVGVALGTLVPLMRTALSRLP
jgi:hypothetical protein